jgi:hypothetical protein
MTNSPQGKLVAETGVFGLTAVAHGKGLCGYWNSYVTISILNTGMLLVADQP